MENIHELFHRKVGPAALNGNPETVNPKPRLDPNPMTVNPEP